ncbi:hypothetical protein GCM10025881_35400 [Pseudolysinimonas kribbensis]|uniref:Zinc ribbon domain-containing protein n=1 Tax=Pseudolysinimonas kribbensis TaxID=433641 RepID=A0ABQ6K7S6_9MICO|nr:hypothetical protein GCM10025881_35400 [Pseudolysinimonas kribbensis]
MRLGAAADSRFCSACGTALAADRVVAPLDVATRRTIQFGALTILANIVVGAAGFGVVYAVSDASRLLFAAMVLEALHVIVVGALAAQTLRFGIRAVRLTRDGRTRMSVWGVIGIVLAALVLLTLVLSFAAVLTMYLGAL